MRPRSYTVDKHRSHISGSRYARRHGLDDMLARRMKSVARQLGMRLVVLWEGEAK